MEVVSKNYTELCQPSTAQWSLYVPAV